MAKGLGKGLGALIQEVDEGEFREIPINSIKTNPYQPRLNINKEHLEELAESIKEKGVIQPILVREVDGGYEIIAGERRWRAAQIAQLSTIPAIVRNLEDQDVLEVALVENIQREDLTPIETARAYKELQEIFGLTQEEIAKRVGKSRSAVANTMRLLNLPDKIQMMIVNGEISEGHGRALLSLKSEEDMLLLADRIVKEKLSVREVEKIVRQSRVLKERKERSILASRDPEVERVERKFMETLGTKVVLQGNLDKGKLVVYYYTRDDLDRIFDIVVGKTEI